MEVADMPWQETSADMERMKFIVALDAGEESFAALCRRFEISRQTGYKWKARFEEGGVGALEDRRPLALSHPNAIDDIVADHIAEARKAHPSWGPKKLKPYLTRQLPDISWPALSTFGEVLSRRGLVAPRKRRLRVPPLNTTLAEYSGPNAVWCVDHKGHFALDARKRCYPLTLVDGASRYLIKCEALASTTGEQAWPHLERAFRECGLPVRIRSDNGAPFANASVPGRLSHLSVWWIKLGIIPELIEPGHPGQNGRLERFHRTLEEAIGTEPRTMDKQQRAFDAFRAEYNHERPHEALGQEVPASVYETSWREYPAVVKSPEYEGETIRRMVSVTGRVQWRGHDLFLTKVLAGEPVGLDLVDDGVWTVRFGGLYLVTLDYRGREPKVTCQRPAPGSAQPHDHQGEITSL